MFISHFIFVFNYFRLGLEMATVYMECEIDPPTKKKAESLETKKLRAVLYTHHYLSAGYDICLNIFSAPDVMMLELFLSALHFINDYFKYYTEKFSKQLYTNNIQTMRRQYCPMLLKNYQHDVYALFHDVFTFGRRVEPFLKSTEDVVALNIYIRFSYTVVTYLKAVIEHNPCFHLRQPQHICKTFHKDKSGLRKLLRAIE